MKHIPATAFDGAEPLDAPPKAKGPFHYWKKHLMTLAVSRSKALTGNGAKVMLRLIAYANESTGLAWPSLDTLADETGFSRKVVKAAIANAEECGLLTVERSAGGRHGETNTFRPAWHLAVKERGPSRDRVRGSSREATGSLQGTDGVPVGHGRGPCRVPEQIGEIRQDKIIKEESSLAHARELPSSLGREDDRRRSQADKVPLPADYQFPAEAVTAARTAPRGLSEVDIDQALKRFRKAAGNGQNTAAEWAKRGTGYLATVEAKPDPDEMVKVKRDALDFGRLCKRSEVKPWEGYTDSKGALHAPRNSKPLSTAGTRSAV